MNTLIEHYVIGNNWISQCHWKYIFPCWLFTSSLIPCQANGLSLKNQRKKFERQVVIRKCLCSLLNGICMIKKSLCINWLIREYAS